MFYVAMLLTAAQVGVLEGFSICASVGYHQYCGYLMPPQLLSWQSSLVCTLYNYATKVNYRKE